LGGSEDALMGLALTVERAAIARTADFRSARTLGGVVNALGAAMTSLQPN
jgi:hypothetical protein